MKGTTPLPVSIFPVGFGVIAQKLRHCVAVLQHRSGNLQIQFASDCNGVLDLLFRGGRRIRFQHRRDGIDNRGRQVESHSILDCRPVRSVHQSDQHILDMRLKRQRQLHLVVAVDENKRHARPLFFYSGVLVGFDRRPQLVCRGSGLSADTSTDKLQAGERRRDDYDLYVIDSLWPWPKPCHMARPRKKDQLRDRLAVNVRTHRLERNWTQEDLGAKAGISQRYISNVESGKTAATVDTVQKLADALGVDGEHLLKASPRQ
ncbi:MAG: XRE family transcriptional regulator [Nevskiaceae bacterium]|nr:MAG: XRE family transcriptional regulator [Nevskiaceae bacterium]